jgi:hypothetical protein
LAGFVQTRPVFYNPAQTSAAVKAEIIPSNPLERVDSFKIENKELNVLTKEQARALAMEATGAAIVGGDGDALRHFLPSPDVENTALIFGDNLVTPDLKRDEKRREEMPTKKPKTPKSAQKTHFPKNDETT